MTDEQKTQIKELVDRLMSMSLEELRERAKSHVNNPFEVFQEMSDAIEESEEYQEFLHSETFFDLTDEPVVVSEFRTSASAVDTCYSFSSFSPFETHTGNGGQKWATAA
ncbi:MAG: hypothetical protein IJB53_00920 [Mailhella sp.]|nr:hypothetical protein [Mailhella sp.]